MAVAPPRRRRHARVVAEGRAQRRGDQRQAMLRPARRHLDLLGLERRIFRQRGEAHAFYDEIEVMLARQMGAPNSPQWFNTGLHWAYGIDGPAQGHYYVDHRPARCAPPKAPTSTRSRTPALSSRSNIRQRGRHHGSLGARGAAVQIRLRHGSNFSKLRGDGETAVGRRPLVGADELPEDRRPRRRRDQNGRHDAPRREDGHRRRRPSRYEQYIDWKVIEEQKVAALVAGSKLAANHLNRVLAACREARRGRGPVRSAQKPGLEPEIRLARKAMIPENYIRRVIQFARQGSARSTSAPTTRIGIGSLSDRRRPELEQYGAHHQRIPRKGRNPATNGG